MRRSADRSILHRALLLALTIVASAATPGPVRADDPPSWLRVNGGLDAEVESGAPFTLSWDLPEDAAFPHLFVTLRVERDHTLEEAFLLRRCFLSEYCFNESVLEPPPGGPPFPASFMTHNDDALGAAESAGVRRRAAPRHGDLAMRAAPDYHTGVVYSFQAVYHHAGDLVLRSSNPVSVRVRTRLAAVPPVSARADLAVTHLEIFRTGPDAGRLTIVVGDVSGRHPPFSGRVPYRITTLRDPISSEAPMVVEEGTVELNSFGLGAFRSTFRILPGAGPLLVRVEVAFDGTVEEVWRDNNVRERYFGEAAGAPRVHEVWKEQEGALWMLLGVRWSDREGIRLVPVIAPVTSGPWPVSFACQWLGVLAGPAWPRGVDQIGHVFCGVGRTERVMGIGPVVTHEVVFRGDEPALRPDPARKGGILTLPVTQSIPVEKVWNLPEALHDVGPALPQLGARIVRAAIQLRDRGAGRHEVEQAVLYELVNSGRGPVRSVALETRVFGPGREDEIAVNLPEGTTIRYCDRVTYTVGDVAAHLPVSVTWTARLTSPVIALGPLVSQGDLPLRDQGGGLWSRGGATPGGSLSDVCAE